MKHVHDHIRRVHSNHLPRNDPFICAERPLCYVCDPADPGPHAGAFSAPAAACVQVLKIDL